MEQTGLRRRTEVDITDTVISDGVVVAETIDVTISEKEIQEPEKKEEVPTTSELLPASLNRTGKILIIASCLASVGFWALGHYSVAELTPYGGRTLLKWLSIALITALVVRYCNLRASRQEFWFVFALLCHSLGDVILAQGTTLPSIPAFFLGHLFYIFTFMFDLPPRLRAGITKRKIFLFLLLAVAEIVLGVSILPLLSYGFLIPVLCYMMIIFCFASTALLPIYKYRWSILGVMLYCASDTLIAIDLFYTSLGYFALLTWPLYYFSQLFLVVGFLKEKGKVRSVFIEREISVASIKQTRLYTFSEKFVRRINLPV